MTVGVIDTTVVIHLYRGDKDAIAWVKTQSQLGVTPITWMETIYGANGLRGQVESLKILCGFTLIHFTSDDQEWAMQQLLTLRLQWGVATNDCLIASVCHRLQVPLYTHNIKHIARILDPRLVIKPY